MLGVHHPSLRMLRTRQVLAHRSLLLLPQPHRFLNTSSTAYPSGSVKHPTLIIPSTSSTPTQLIHKHKPNTIPHQHRQLPDLPNRVPFQILTFLVIGSAWMTFIYFSTNSEKFNSSVVKAIMFELRGNGAVRAALGEGVQPQRDEVFGQVWVEGKINMMQGSIDVAFNVAGAEHPAKVYFTSVRRDRQAEFEILRWKLIRHDGLVVDLVDAHQPKILRTTTVEGGEELAQIHSLPAHNLSHSDLIPSAKSHPPAISQQTPVRLV